MELQRYRVECARIRTYGKAVHFDHRKLAPEGKRRAISDPPTSLEAHAVELRAISVPDIDDVFVRELRQGLLIDALRAEFMAELKKVIEAIKDLVTDGNIEVSETGMNLQAMDSSHVSLVSLVLHTDMFEHFRCDRNVTLGINLPNFAKILKCSGNDDSVTLKAQDDGENLAIVFESEGQERVSEFELKLMDIDAESLGIPDQDYNTNVKMSSAEFQRIVRDMTVLGDTCSIGCTKEGVKFSVSGDLGQGNITLRQTNSVDKEEEAVTIEMDEPVELNFALRYLGFFTKASPLCPRVTISMSPDVPIVVAYNVGGEKDTEGAGSLSFYLAPKIDEE